MSDALKVLALDPGPKMSAWCLWDGKTIQAGYTENAALLDYLKHYPEADHLAIEMIASYGMPVGAEVFETCVWIGRFAEAWGREFTLVKRLECKMHLCHDSRAKDPNIRRALLDRFGAPGTKKAPGLTYGISGDQWAALAVAVTWHDKHGKASG